MEIIDDHKSYAPVIEIWHFQSVYIPQKGELRPGFLRDGVNHISMVWLRSSPEIMGDGVNFILKTNVLHEPPVRHVQWLRSTTNASAIALANDTP